MPVNFFKRLAAKPTSRSAMVQFSAPLELDHVSYAVGDIHGRADLLERLLERIGEDAGGIGKTELVFVGDYVDRGEESRAVLERLAALCADHPAKVICLLGNHEQMMLDFLDDPGANAGRWLRNGGLQTMASFAVGGVTENPGPEQARQAADDLRTRLGSELEAWLRSRPLQHSNGNVHFVHAAADPALPMSEQERKHLIWGHPAFSNVDRSDAQWVVHGHTVVDAPQAEGGRISIDTGAWFSGRLTSVRLAPDGLSFLEC